MPKVSEYYVVGDRAQMTVERLLVIMEDMYRDLAIALNQKPDLVERNVDGQTSDTFLSNGTLNINTSTLKVEMLTKHQTTAAVTWTTLS